jgi:hypothetical protein
MDLDEGAIAVGIQYEDEVGWTVSFEYEEILRRC